jgi:tRNA(fMet)-specific endonuclease VapC
MYLLDTNHCSHLLNSHPKVVQKLEEMGDTLVATCVIVRGELIFMAFRSEQKATNLERLANFFQEIKIYPIDEMAADIYGEIKSAVYDRFGPREKAKRKKTKLETLGFSENDLWIAAVAMRHGLTVVSADSDFQRLQEVAKLSSETWWSPE